MNSVDRVKELCRQRKIPVSRLEKDLGYSNGYIGQLRKGVFPSDRITEIANYLNVSIDYLMTGKESSESQEPAVENTTDFSIKLDDLESLLETKEFPLQYKGRYIELSEQRKQGLKHLLEAFKSTLEDESQK